MWLRTGSQWLAIDFMYPVIIVIVKFSCASTIFYVGCSSMQVYIILL